MRRKILGGIIVLLASIAFIYFGLFVLTSSSVEQGIKRSREIEMAFREAANFIEDFEFKNKRLPFENEFYHRPSVDRYPISKTITLNSCAEPLPEKFGVKPENSYYLGYWRGEWCEFFIGWDQTTTLQFDRNEYYPFRSYLLTWIFFALSTVGLILGIFLFTKLNKSENKK